jgi:hypothetical protein
MALEESEGVDWTQPDFDRVKWQVSLSLVIQSVHPLAVRNSDAFSQSKKIIFLKRSATFNNTTFPDTVTKTVTGVVILKTVLFILLHNLSRLLAIFFLFNERKKVC